MWPSMNNAYGKYIFHILLKIVKFVSWQFFIYALSVIISAFYKTPGKMELNNEVIELLKVK